MIPNIGAHVRYDVRYLLGFMLGIRPSKIAKNAFK